MNSVFSAFKTSKSDGNIQSNKVKKLGPENSSSYANLRHIREIGSSAKMSSFVGNNDDDDIAPKLRLTKCPPTLHSTTADGSTFIVSTPSAPSLSSMSSMEQIFPQITKTKTHQIDCYRNTMRSIHSESSMDKNIVSTANDTTEMVIANEQNLSEIIPVNSLSVISFMNISSNDEQVTDGVDADHSSNDRKKNNENTDITNPSRNSSDLACLSDSPNVLNGTETSDKHQVHSNCVQTIDGDVNGKHTPILSAASSKKINRYSESNAPTISNNTSSNRFYKRLSVSGIGSNPLPSVHGRSTSNSQNGSNGNCGSSETKRTRISTHQRNLSLDFR